MSYCACGWRATPPACCPAAALSWPPGACASPSILVRLQAVSHLLQCSRRVNLRFQAHCKSDCDLALMFSLRVCCRDRNGPISGSTRRGPQGLWTPYFSMPLLTVCSITLSASCCRDCRIAVTGCNWRISKSCFCRSNTHVLRDTCSNSTSWRGRRRRSKSALPWRSTACAQSDQVRRRTVYVPAVSVLTMI